MKIVVLVSKLHAASELALNQLVCGKEVKIVAVVRSDVSVFRWQYWKYMTFGVGRAGVFYGLMIAIMAYWHLIGMAIASFLIWNRRRKWLSVDKLCKKHGIKLHDTADINSKKSLDFIRSMSPDIMVSLSFDQILKKDVLKTPKKAVLNVHPGLLPKYGGIWPGFWELLNKEKYGGVSIHHMIEKVDAGEVIAQSKFLIEEEDTKFCLSIKSAQCGVKLLLKILGKMKKGVHLSPIKLSGKVRYYSLPTKMQFEEFSAQGRKLFSILSLKKVLKRFY